MITSKKETNRISQQLIVTVLLSKMMKMSPALLACLLFLVVTLCSLTMPCSFLSLVPLTEPVSPLDRGEEQRGSEDPTGERGRGVEGLLWRRVSGDSGWVRHEIRSGVHLSGYDVSTTLIYGLLPHQSLIVSFRRVEERRRWEKESRRAGGE